MSRWKLFTDPLDGSFAQRNQVDGSQELHKIVDGEQDGKSYVKIIVESEFTGNSRRVYPI